MKLSKLLSCCYKKNKSSKGTERNGTERKDSSESNNSSESNYSSESNNSSESNSSFENIIKPIKWSETVPFKLPITGGQVIKVYDGDTITIASKLPFENSPIYRFSVRLAGIDTPEIKGKTEQETILAKEAKNKLHTMIMDKYILLKNINTEKYGRILADVYLDDIHINKWMVDQKLAVGYNGGKKTFWD
jgi:endonuclease YncB( thermonuclease family)